MKVRDRLATVEFNSASRKALDLWWNRSSPLRETTNERSQIAMLFESHAQYQLSQKALAIPQPTNLSQEQLSAVQNIRTWIYDVDLGREKEQHATFALSGPAGSGKTSLIKALKTSLACDVVVSAMTNKAVDVLKRKGIVDAVTTHRAGLVTRYKVPGDTLRVYLDLPEPDETLEEDLLAEFYSIRDLRRAWMEHKFSGINGGAKELGIHDFHDEFFEAWLPKELHEGVLIVDEASMLGGSVLPKLQQTFSKIILVGDEFQLPPVEDTPIFWDDSVIRNRITLTEVHRQIPSGDVYRLADRIKAGEKVNTEPHARISMDMVVSGVPIIVWTNDYREFLTRRIREKLGRSSPIRCPVK